MSAMTTHDQVLASGALPAGEAAAPPSRWIKSFRMTLVTWAGSCANYWTAAAMYEQLSALSDAELARRGLSRATLASHVRAAAGPGFTA
jgi:hypothetical protein